MLFTSEDLDKDEELYQALPHELKAMRFINEDTRLEMAMQLGVLKMGEDLHFATDSRWHLHDLLVYVVHQIGPCDLYFCTYSIKETAARLIAKMQEDGLLRSVHSLLHYRIEQHGETSLDVLRGSSSAIGFMRTHAKLVVLRNEAWGVTITGSANFTANTQADCGVLTCDLAVADYRINWIKKNIDEGLDTGTISDLRAVGEEFSDL